MHLPHLFTSQIKNRFAFGTLTRQPVLFLNSTSKVSAWNNRITPPFERHLNGTGQTSSKASLLAFPTTRACEFPSSCHIQKTALSIKKPRGSLLSCTEVFSLRKCHIRPLTISCGPHSVQHSRKPASRLPELKRNCCHLASLHLTTSWRGWNKKST